jgi:hypothetical protein
VVPDDQVPVLGVAVKVVVDAAQILETPDIALGKGLTTTVVTAVSGQPKLVYPVTV